MFESATTEADGVGVYAAPELDLSALFDMVIESGSAWSQLAPSGLLLDVLAGLSPESLDADGALEAAAALERVISLAQAVQLRMLARFAALRPAAERDGRPFSEFAADEAAPALRVSRHSAAGRMALGCDLVARLPETLRALHRGMVDLPRARAVSELTASLSDEQAATVEARVLPRAGTQVVARVRAAVRREVIRVDPDGAQRRETRARADRRVTLTPVEDGMAELWALLPAADAVAAYHRVAQTARALPADERSADQRRADCFTDLLLGGQTRRVGAQISVTVAASTLSGLDDQPGDLDGYGPITADSARALAGGALSDDTTWRRLLTDPADGRVLDVGRRRYRPPVALADLVRARDRTCRFPGCRLPAERCDLDHTVAYPRGATSAANLAALCRHHHRLKHHTDWRVTQDRHGRLTWISPTGRRHVTEPEPLTDPEPRRGDVPADHSGLAAPGAGTSRSGRPVITQKNSNALSATTIAATSAAVTAHGRNQARAPSARQLADATVRNTVGAPNICQRE